MELIGLLIGLMLALPLTLVTSTVFCLLAFWAVHRFPRLSSPVAKVASIIVCSVILEVILSVGFGTLLLHRHLEPIYFVVHFTNFILAPPAVACVILVHATRLGTRTVVLRVVAICACWLTCMVSLLGSWAVNEAIYGIDDLPPTETNRIHRRLTNPEKMPKKMPGKQSLTYPRAAHLGGAADLPVTSERSHAAQP